MKLKNFLWGIEIITCIFWVLFLLILFFINPFKSDANIMALFYTSLFVAIGGTWSILEYNISIKIKGMDELNKKISRSVRHGAMVSLVLTGLLFMQGIRVLSVLDGVIFVVAILLFEAYFLTRNTVVTEKRE